MEKITLYTWDESGVFAGSVQCDPLGSLPPRSTTDGPVGDPPDDKVWLWADKWVAGAAPLRNQFIPQLVSSDQLRTALTAEYERRMQAIAAGYPPSERESWPVQTSEAYALLVDATAPTPWIDAASTARGLDRLELAQRIVAKDAQYRVISGTLSGVRQRIEDQIDAAGDDQSALKAIDVTQGWPE